MKQIIIIILFATGALLGIGQAYGQKVYKDADGKVILDCSSGSKMPQNAVTNVQKYTATTTASNTVFVLGTIEAANTANAKIYYKLEIAPQDMLKNGTLGGGEAATSWAEAYNNCKNLNHNGTGWRLPTQRELQMMWVFCTAINPLSGYLFGAYYYWSATEISSSSVAWYVSFSSGHTSYGNKNTTDFRVRCVREL